MALVYEQTRALMWKCLIMRVRHKMMTFIECIFPMAMLIVFMLVVVKIGEHPVGDESAFGDPMPIQNFSNPDSRISETLLRYSVMNNNLLYMPDHPCSTRIMRRAKLMMHLRAGCPMTRTKIIPVSKESNMIDLFYAFGRQSGDELTSAINFMGSCESWYEFAVQKLQFQLYTRGNVKSQGFSKKTFAGPFEYNMYLPPYNTFVELLILLSDARIMSAFEMKLDPRLADERWMNASSDTSGRLILDRILDQIERFDPFKNQTTNNSSNAAKQDDSLAVSAQNRFRDMNLRNRTKLAQNRTEINNIVIDLINAQLFSELRNRLQSPSFRSSIGDYFNSEYFDTLTDRLETGANSVVTNANNETNVVFPDLSRIRKRIRALIAVLNDHEKLRLLNVSLITAYPELINMRIPIPLHDIEINRYVYPAYTQRPPPMITDTLPYIVVFGFIVSLPLLMKSITEEKNRGIRELFRLMGLTQRAYVASIVAGYLPVMLFHSIVLSILIGVPVLNGSAIFPHCSLSLMIVMFLLYGITSVLFTLCLSVPFQRPVLSLMCTALAHIFTTLPDYLLEPALVGNSNFVCFFRVLSCLLPNMSLNYGIRLLSAKELYSQPQEWSNLFDMDYHYQALSIGIVMCVQLWSCVFYLFLYWYLDNVWPWQQGVPKSPFFIFSPRFWQSVGSGPSAKSHLNFMASHAIRPLRNQGEYFESQPEAQSYAFRLRDVRKEFGSGKNRNVALDNVNLDLPEGELCVLLGHNGAGKSTLMNLITGVAVPTQGQVVINGFDMRTETLQARASISFCPQHNALYDELSALEHMWLFGVLRTASVSATLDRDQETKSKSESVSQFGSVEHVRLLTELGLREKAHQAAQGYSGGQKRKLCLAIALLGNPQLIILDEPTSGMDPEARRSVVEVLLRHRRRRSILLTTHFMEEADAVADRICIMSSGKVKCYGSPSFLRATFGAGYKLRIAKATGFQPSHRLHLIALLSQHFPRGEIIQESVGELIYALDSGAVEESDALDGSTDRLEQPLSAVETQTSDQDHGRLARFFAQFEPVRDLLHVSSCGLSVTTLEDVFLRVVTMDSPIPHLAINDDNVSATTDWSEMTSNVDLSSSVDPKENTSSWSLAISDDFETVRCKDNRSVSPLPMRSSLLSSQPTGNLTKSGKLKSNAFSLSASSQQNFKNCAVETFPLLTGWPLQMNRLRALIIKRIHFAKRYYSMLIFQLLLPLCMFMLLFELDSFLRRKLTVSQRFELRSDKMYGSTEGFVQFSPEVKRRINWERLQDAFNQTFIDERVRMHVLPSDVNPQDYQIELTKQLSIDQYLSHHLYGFSIYMANEAQLPMYRDGKKRSSLWESIDWLIDNEKNKQEEITAYSPLTGSKSLPDKSSDAWVASSMDPQQIKQADKMRLENDKLATFPNQSKGNKSNAVQALQWHEIEELLRARRNGLGPQHGLSEQDLQLLAAIHKTSQEMSLTVQVWHQNEALHALPLGVQILYQSLFRWFNITDDGRPIHLHSWNRPMRTQFEYLTIIEFMHLFKILWGIFCSIAFSFMSASYVLQPAAERSSQAKLLQQMTGTPLWLYWIAHAVFDMIFHLILSALLITVFQLLDSKHLFTAHFESMLSMFVLLVLFGACMLPICYCVSLWISTSNTAFSASLGINLVGGVFLTLIDYIFGTLYNRKYMSTSVRTISLNLFRMFPLFSLTKAINKLYLVGSHYGACSYFTESFLEMNCVKNVPYIGCCKKICEPDCYSYQSPFGSEPNNIKAEVIALTLSAIFWSLLLFLLETQRVFKWRRAICKCVTRLRWLQRISKQGSGSDVNKDKTSQSALDSIRTHVRRAHSVMMDDDVLAEQNMVNALFNVKQASSSSRYQSINDPISFHSSASNSGTFGSSRMRQSDFALLVHELTKQFDEKVAVDSLSFSVHQKECFGLLGINGAGKTTTFRMLVGELMPSSGDAMVDGISLMTSTLAFRSRIGYCPQFDGLLENLSGQETLELFARLRGVPCDHLESHVARLIRLCDLTRHCHRVSDTYSGGNKRKLSVAIALTGSPRMLLLDEPTCGVDPKARRRIWQTLVNVQQSQQCSLLLTSHSMDECEALCGRIGIMTAGQLRCLGSIQHLRAKFGNGYSLCIKLRACYLHDEAYLLRLQSAISEALPSSVIKDVHQTVMDYHIGDTTIGWANLFSILDSIKQKFNLENYFIGDTTLEEIFVGFARQQETQQCEL